MESLTCKQLRGLFFAIELNLLLWLFAFGAASKEAPESFIKIEYVTAAGFIIAAVLQHWAYYNLYKRVKKEQGTEPA